MTDQRVVITPDPHHPHWFLASGPNLLFPTHMIATVERTKAGIAFHAEAADEVRAALRVARYLIIDAASRDQPTPQPHRGKRGWFHEPGEEIECRRCTPAHNPAAAVADAKAQVAAALAALHARSQDIQS